MKKLVALLCLGFGLCGCAANEIDTSYRGPDAGALVMSLGYTEPKADFYLLYYAPVPRQGPAGLISIHTSGDIFRVIDYTGKETGSVVTQHLKPGDYEFFSADADDPYHSEIALSSAKRFSLPFTIRPGETTYIGSYTGYLTQGTRHTLLFGDQPVPATFYFVVSDQQERDMAIARARDPKLPAVTDKAVPAAAALPSPYFRDKPLD